MKSHTVMIHNHFKYIHHHFTLALNTPAQPQGNKMSLRQELTPLWRLSWSEKGLIASDNKRLGEWDYWGTFADLLLVSKGLNAPFDYAEANRDLLSELGRWFRRWLKKWCICRHILPTSSIQEPVASMGNKWSSMNLFLAPLALQRRLHDHRSQMVDRVCRNGHYEAKTLPNWLIPNIRLCWSSYWLHFSWVMPQFENIRQYTAFCNLSLLV